jgi:hypothetical protein
MTKSLSPVREGVVAGVIGASTVAIWFLIVDSIARRPLFTPGLLGHAVLGVLGPSRNDSLAATVIFYTIVHYAVFILAGIVLSLIVNRGEQEDSVLVVLLILFVAFELGFYGFTAVLAQTRLRELAWYQVALGNLLAAAAMGTYIWRRHPALTQRFAHALSGQE